jgi:hypothetical protein
MKHSASAALNKYRKNLTFPARLRNLESRSAPQTPTTKRLREKKFGYSPDAPENTAQRPQGCWARGLTSHNSDSPHAYPSSEGYEDTSYFNSWHFSVSQRRYFYANTPTRPPVY